MPATNPGRAGKRTQDTVQPSVENTQAQAFREGKGGPVRSKPPAKLPLTHFAYWSCGVLLQTTPDRYAEEVRKVERLIGPPWLKGINRVYGRYEPIP